MICNIYIYIVRTRFSSFFRVILKFDSDMVSTDMVSLMNHTAGQCLMMFYPFPELQPMVMSCFPELVQWTDMNGVLVGLMTNRNSFPNYYSQIHLVQVTPGGDAEENKENAGEIPSWIFLTTTDVQSFGTQRIKNWSACLFFFDIIVCC